MAAIDWGCLRNSTMNDPELAKETIELFLNQTPVQLALLSGHVLQSDTEAVRRSAHRLKGGCLTVGAGGMAEICEQLETLCEGGSGGDLGSLADALAQEFIEVKKEADSSFCDEEPGTQVPRPRNGLAD
jgi:HPt (histidine-containing phosphotransfer) domain-containing protein